jgi:tRNA-Thr(GGU) m(6)t(6)A37 methyltransferase TsaA
MEKTTYNPPLMSLKQIGVIRTPYKWKAPRQPVEEGECFLEVYPEFQHGLRGLETFRYIYVLFWMDRVEDFSLEAEPPWAGGIKVGVFASRSPRRPNPIGLSVVKLLSIEGNKIKTSSIDAIDGTPLLDIKPYVKYLDSKEDANLGWAEDLPDREHLILHLRGIPHDY